MKESDFRQWMKLLGTLTAGQKERLNSLLKEEDYEAQLTALIEARFADELFCPHCHSVIISRWGHSHGLQRYRCGDCSKTFNALTGTPLSRLRNKNQWIRYARELIQGHSVRQAAEAIGVHRNTSFRWRHRFLSQAQGDKAKSLKGIAEADETFFLESFKGRKRGMPRRARGRGGKGKGRGTGSDQIPVLLARDRHGRVYDDILKGTSTGEISRALEGRIGPDTVLCADGAAAYRLFAERENILLKEINRSQGQHVVERVFHIQNVNAYGSRLKQWMRRFNGVATHYLANYLAWRRLLEQHQHNLTSFTVLKSALGLNPQQLKVT